jgi:hypothetical protein
MIELEFDATKITFPVSTRNEGEFETLAWHEFCKRFIEGSIHFQSRKACRNVIYVSTIGPFSVELSLGHSDSPNHMAEIHICRIKNQTRIKWSGLEEFVYC